MVAIMAGAGLGLERSSALVLGGAGSLGHAILGRGGDNVYVNAASGNLVVQNADEMLFGTGPDNVLTRTYNSLSGSAPQWQLNVVRHISVLTGTLNTVGSTVTRSSWDGSRVVYAWDAGKSAYVGREGSGGYDTLTRAGSVWTWTDGASRVVETYDANNGGRILSSSDVDGNALSFTYNPEGKLSRVTTEDGGYTDLTYTGNQLTGIVTTYTSASGPTSMSRVSYGYDSSDRLTTVTVDLTPENSSDNSFYTTTYSYVNTTKRISKIAQSDGSILQVAYTNVGGALRVSKLTEHEASGETRVTLIAYDVVNRITTVTDPLGAATQLAYDASGQLLSVTTPPPVSGANPLVTAFAYNSMGDVVEVTAPDGSTVTYTYDDQGNLTQEVDGVGNTVERTYGAENQILTETHYLIAAQGGVGPGAPTTVRFAYDAENHLRYRVGAEGDIVEYVYNGAGEQTSVIEYVTATYDVSGLASDAPVSEAALDAWKAGVDRTATKRTDTAYDFRGNVSKVTTFEKVISDGSGDVTGDLTEVIYVYDQSGRLLSRQPSTKPSAELFVYDGLGRLIASTDLAGHTTQFVFNNAANTTVVTLANGLVQTSTYNKIGEIISYTESGSGVATSTTSYKYDDGGRLRVVTDASGRTVHNLYDAAGRRVAEIQADGAITEFRYNSNSQLAARISYAQKLSAVQLASLIDGSGNPAAVDIASVRPSDDPTDRWEWRVYDAAQRLVETIDGAGAATVFTYDGTSRVTSKTSYARLFDQLTLDTFKAAPPTTVQVPGGASATASFASTYSANLGPTAANDTFNVVRGTALTFNPRANDTDPNGDSLTITHIGTPANGVAVINAGGSITYTPAALYEGADSFSYTISDGRGGTATATISLVVAAPENRLPTAVNDHLVTSQGASVSFAPQANDTDPDGDTLAVASVSVPTHGTVTINVDGTLTYTPDAGFSGSDAFTYTVSDGRGGEASASVVVTVVPVANQGPVAVNDAVLATQDTSVVIDPRVNDSDPDGDLLFIQSFTQPANGVVVINSNGTLTYTAAAGYVGSDSFNYTLSDGRGGSATATVGITVQSAANTAPVSANDHVSTTQGVPVTFNPRRNDSDADGDGLTITGVGTPTHGSIVINDGSSLTYTPAGGYAGPDSFTYTVSDGRGGISTATVNLTVYSENEFTALTVSSVQQWGDGGTGVDFSVSRQNDYLGEGYPALIVEKSHPPAWTPAYDGWRTQPGSVALFAADGGGNAWEVTPGQKFGVAFEAMALGATTDVTISVHYWDSNWADVGDSETFTVSLADWARIETEVLTAPGGARYAAIVVEPTATGDQRNAGMFGLAIRKTQFVRLTGNQAMPSWPISAPSNTDPTVVNDLVHTVKDTPITFNPRANDSDIDRDGLTITNVGSAAHGVATINSVGTITYSPTAGYIGTDTFTYAVTDGRGGVATGTVTVSVAATITGSNSAPVAANDGVTTSSGVPVTFDPRANDADPDGDILGVVSVGTPAHGVAVINGNGTVTYTPQTGYSGTDAFSYTVSDGRGGSTTATVQVTVSGAGANAAPIASNDSIATTRGTPVTVDPRINDADPDGDLLTIIAVGAAANGVTTVNSQGAIVYAPNAGYTGADAFTYTVSDGRGGSATATVTVTVAAPTNSAPIAIADSITTNQGVSVTFNPRANDSDADFDGLTITGAGTPSHGSVTINGGFTITYTPTAGYAGDDSFSYTISDGRGGTTTGTVNVVVYAPNEFLGLTSSSVNGWYDGGTGVDFVASTSTNYLGLGHDALLLQKSSPPAGPPTFVNGITRAGSALIYGAEGQGAEWTVNPGERFGVAFDAKGLGAVTHVTVNVHYWNSGWGDLGDSATVTIPVSEWGRVESVLTAPANARYVGLIVEATATGDQRSAPLFGLALRKAQFVRLASGQPMQSWPATNAANTGPVAAGDVVTTSQDAAVTFDPRGNDSDVDRDVLTITATSNPAHGSVTVNPDGSITYTPAAGYSGADSFTYTVSDGRGGSSTATVNVSIQAAGVNGAPIALDDSVTVAASGSVTFSPHANDVDPNGDPLTVSGVGTPGHGTAVINTNGTVTYTPATGYSGSDSFTYTVSDGRGGSATATVNITVAAPSTNAAPTAANDSVHTNRNTAITFNPRLNDVDADNDGLTITAVGAAGHGSVTVNDGFTVTYTPDANYTGSDSFTYTISDGRGGVATATVNVIVYRPNQFTAFGPAATEPWYDGGTGVDYLEALEPNYLSGGHDALVLTKSQPPAATPDYTGSYTRPGSVVVWGSGPAGSAGLEWNVSSGQRLGWAFEALALGAVTHVDVSLYYWNSNWGGIGDSATIRTPVSDSGWARAEGVFTAPSGAAFATIVIEPVAEGDQRSANEFGLAIRKPQFVRLNAGQAMQPWPATADVNSAPTAENDIIAAVPGTAVSFNPRVNDSDEDRDPTTVTALSMPSKGVASINPDGTITYTANAGSSGSDSFTYTLSDGRGGTATATVNVTISASTNPNAAPVAAGDTVLVLRDTAATFDPRGNDVDADGDPLSVLSVTSPTNGMAVVNANGTITYTPTMGYIGPDSFAYTVSDGRGGTATATITITVQAPQNNAPTAFSDSIVTAQGAAVTFNPRGNDIDPDGDQLVIIATSDPTFGSVSVNAGGSLTYTPGAGFAGQDSFTYTVSDGRGGLSTANVVVTVTVPVNSAPVAAGDTVTTARATPIVIDPRGNDADPDGDVLTVIAVSTPSSGSAVINGSGTITYAPDPGFSGVATFTYTVSDGRGGTATASVDVVVRPEINGQPVANDDAIFVFQNSSLTFNPRTNDADPDGDALILGMVGIPLHGAAVIQGGAIVYTPNAGFVGSDSFTYAVEDGRGGVATATVFVTVQEVPELSADDRIVRNFYDRNGRLVGVLDAEGYLTQSIHDASGQVIETIRYANRAGGTARISGTLSEVLSDIGTSSRDSHTWNLYDGRGLLRAAIDGEGGVTRYSYNASSELEQVTRGQKLDVSALLLTRPTLSGLPAAASGAVLETTTYGRDSLGLVTSETRALSGGGTETTTYIYDEMRRLQSTTTAYGSADARVHNQVYDLRGRLVAALGGEGSAALAALGTSPSQAQVDAIYQTYGVIYDYDASDRMVAKREPDGAGTGGNITLYYYDGAGRLTYEINPLGEVRQYAYNSFGERAEIVAYGTRLSGSALAALQGQGGGEITPTLTDAITGNAGLDAINQYGFDVLGRLATKTDPTSATTTLAYNAFGDLVSQVDPFAGTSVVATLRAYDRRGLLLSTTRDAGGLQLIERFDYDAFGRRLQATDASGQVRATEYDRTGRVVVERNAVGEESRYSYDGRGALLARTDAAGRTTSFAYTAFDRQVTMTTPEGVTTTTLANAHGETVSITDGGGRTTSWTYDKDGQVKTVSDAAGVTTSSYDNAGRLESLTDARGIVTTYDYDAANRVLSRVTDAGGLNLVTTYVYDAKGQQIAVTDADGRVTSIEFDLAGRRTKVIEDVGALAIATEYSYDKAGRTLTKTEASGTAAELITTYEYDKAGRLTTTRVDPNGLNLTTTYTYDNVGNVVARTDAAGQVTRYVYDGEGRQIYVVDPTGAVTATSYDAAGRIASTRAYADRMWLGGLPGAELSAAQVANGLAVSAGDQTTTYVYDADGRLRFTILPNAHLVEQVYDGSGNVLRSVAYAGSLAPASSYTVASLTAEISANGWAGATQTRITRTVYDGASRAVFTIDAAGFVTALSYDATGNVVKSTRYDEAYGGPTTPSEGDMAAWVAGVGGGAPRQTERTYYDGAGRVAFVVDALNYLTERQYDDAGRLTKSISHAAAYAATDGTTLAQLKLAFASPASNSQQTSYAYDTAGRLTSVTDANGVVTQRLLDAMGRTTDTIVAYGTPDAAGTHDTYDAAGRLVSRTRAFGAPEASTTSFTYDGLGRVLTTTDARGAVTVSTYDGAGRLLTTTVPLSDTASATTSYTYDGFGNVTSITDPMGNRGYFYYDKLDRQTLSIDPEGYATETRYSLGGEPLSVTRRFTATSGAAVGSRPAIIANARDATTTFTRDKLDRLVSIIDAEGFTESYQLNAFGDQVVVTNKLGGQTTKTYDALGRLTSETLPIISTRANGTQQATSVTNTYQYDARGNLLVKTEAAGLAEQRITTFEYDLLDRLTKTIGQPVEVLSQVDITTISTVTPTEQTFYDARGNVIEQRGADGARTLFFYDDLNQKIAEISPIGALSTWNHDANGRVVSARAYGDVVTIPATAGGTAPAPINPGNMRETTFTYDKANRLVATTVAGIRTGSWNGSTYVTALGNVSTHVIYDAAGNILREVDGAGNSIYSYYDRRGNKIAQVDQENYLTTYVLDAEGNVERETRYATRLATSPSVDSNPQALAASLGSPDDRITVFTYDRNGRRLTESRLNVSSWISNGLQLNAGATTSTISHTYNGLGQVTMRTEAAGGHNRYAYDQMGRLLTETGVLMINLAGNVRRPQTRNYYDGLGNLTRTVAGAEGFDRPDSDHITQYSYGAGGRLASVTDAEGFTRNFAYDAAGRIVRISWDRTLASLATVTEGTIYMYDAAGRTFVQASVTQSGGNWSWVDPLRMRYDAYGAVIEQGIGGVNDALQTTYEYDSAGRVWRTNAGDGTVKVYVYDASGNQTLTIASDGAADLTTFLSVEDPLAQLTDNFTKAVGGVSVPYLVTTVQGYDRRNQATQTRQLDREVHPTAGTRTISHSRAYNAFGEVVTETNALDGQTQYTYTTLGRVASKQRLGIQYFDKFGNSGNIAAERYYHDLSGRQVGKIDSRGSLTTWSLLTSSGYNGEEALYSAEYHADGGVRRIEYDAFLRKREEYDELGNREEFNYDKMNRLTDVYRRERLNEDESKTRLHEVYTYDELGQRVRRELFEITNNSTHEARGAERTEYDAQGRVTLTSDVLGNEVSFSYVWEDVSTTPGSALGTTGGWRKVTTTALGTTITEKVDYFDRTVWRQDEAGNILTMSFDRAGRLTSQVGGTGQNLTYAYFSTGQVRQIADAGTATLSEFGYDSEGNLTYERVWKNGVDVKHVVAEYDAHSRRTWLHNFGDGLRQIDARYFYTSTDDLRAIRHSHYDEVLGYDVTEESWFHYDSMNRMTISHGIKLEGAEVTTEFGGVAIAYDLAGQRISATTRPSGSAGPIRVEAYDYTEDGFVKGVSVRENGSEIFRSRDERDFRGRVTDHSEYNASGTLIFNRIVHYRGYSDQIATEFTHTRQQSGNLLRAVTTNHYGGGYDGVRLDWSSTQHFWSEGAAGGSTPNDFETHYTYMGWDSSVQAQIETRNPATQQATGASTFAYDANGNISTITISGEKPRVVSFVTDGTGQIITRQEVSADPNMGPGSPRDNYHVFGGVRVAHTSNNGAAEFDYYNAMALRTATPSPNLFRSGAAASHASFNDIYAPLNPGAQGQAFTATTYRVAEGDTLRTVALKVWGDEGLWYVLAEANGLNGTEPLAANRVLVVPNKVVNAQNKSSTFRVYDPGQVLGDIQPQQPAPAEQVSQQSKKKGCGTVGKILSVIVAVAVAFVATPLATKAILSITGAASGTAAGAAAAVAGGAVGGAAGSIAGQGVAIATGVQDQFSWKGVAMAAISGGVGGGLEATGFGSQFGGPVTQGAIRSVTGNVITQGVAVATGLQSRFDWTGVAVAGISGAAFAAATPFAGQLASYLTGGNALTQPLTNALAGGAAAIASAATRSTFEGTNFGDNVLAALPDVIGSTIGNAIGGRINQAIAERARQEPPRYDPQNPRYSGKSRAEVAQITINDVVTASGNPALIDQYPEIGEWVNKFAAETADVTLRMRDRGLGLDDALTLLGPSDPDDPWRNGELTVTGRPSVGHKAAGLLVEGQALLESLPQGPRMAFELAMSVVRGGPVGAIGSYALSVGFGQALNMIAGDAIEVAAAKVGAFSMSVLSGSSASDELALINRHTGARDEASLLTRAGATILGIAAFGKFAKGGATSQGSAGVEPGTGPSTRGQLGLNLEPKAPQAGGAPLPVYGGPSAARPHVGQPTSVGSIASGGGGGAAGRAAARPGSFRTILEEAGEFAPPEMVNPHPHHILYKVGVGEKQQALVVEGQGYLREVGIDPVNDIDNLVWAPNAKGQHTIGNLEPLVRDLRAASELGASRADIYDILATHGELARLRSVPK